MLEKYDVENVSYIGDSFPHAFREQLHHLQNKNHRMKLTLVFMVPSTEPEGILRFVTVKVPAGLPIFKIRMFVHHCEEQLIEIYGRAKRANHVIIQKESSDEVTYSYNIPLSDVVFI